MRLSLVSLHSMMYAAWRTLKTVGMIAICIAIVMPEGYGILSVLGLGLVHALGLAAYLVVPVLLLSTLNIPLSRPRLLVLLAVWISFVQGAVPTTSPAVGSLIAAPFSLLFGRAAIPAGAVGLVLLARALSRDRANKTRCVTSDDRKAGKTVPLTNGCQQKAEAVSALVNLGYSRQQAELAVGSVEICDDTNLDSIIRQSLQVITK